MFRLTREVRFAINPRREDNLCSNYVNGYAGIPGLTGIGHYFALRLTIAGTVAEFGYLTNIKKMDAVVRDRAISTLDAHVRSEKPLRGISALVNYLFERLAWGWGDIQLETIELSLSPFLSVSCHASERPMTRLSQKFEFSATHRLHLNSVSDEENRELYGKCNNPHGHGHNYEVQVTIAGTPDESGLLMEVPTFERIVHETVITRFDHKNLNVECSEFTDLVPSVENIARVVYELLKPKLQGERARLATVTVWETPKTWCEYSDG
jgi:6-pyruvoyltetrahydropterin/6-carboxytetrahydropterin synthase